ncbi:tRNA (5-methylaminomethyl-2-thiouridine)(34)-methyltransferase MnmD [bacterium]|jgi:tRNA U34 5-methylaminomethyl-2-thiouridine-forming methyltransferase MnmC|nr:tRNA (5-methylaminomethyl-2-thiouridine)(34)-methyltransferase MnmD [bacterium]
MELKITDDGSHTLSIPNSSECYHSTHGAIQESNHVFIDAGLKFVARKSPDTLKILEIGFGTGLNALLTIHESIGQPIHYTTIEPFPISEALSAQLNYEKQLNVENGLFSKLHTSQWEKDCAITSSFTLHKTKIKLEETTFSHSFDLVYFDAFSPDTEPSLWTPEVFKLLNTKLHPESIIVTYCSKGIVKQALKDAGFKVKRLPGPPGKWHMLRARLA